MKIGVFDSGIGGLSILKELYAQGPHLDYYYFSDSRFSPYGNKDQAFIYERSKFITEVFLSMNISHIVVACNTATAWCIDLLRKEFPHVNFFGVEPYINVINKDRNLSLKRGILLVTELMSKSKRYLSLKNRLDPEDKLLTIPLASLAEDIENAYFTRADRALIVKKNLDPHLDKFRERDFIILGCTHYPIIAKEIQKTLGVSCISPCQSVAEYVIHSLGHKRDSGPRKINFFDSKQDSEWRILNYKELILF